jgi:DNA-binding CsgD family transcriptional regulator
MEDVFAQLTPREMEVLKCLVRGMPNKLIAAELNCSDQTVKNFITAILRKLNVQNRTEAAVLASKLGLPERTPSKEVNMVTEVHEHGEHVCYCPSCGYETTVGENVRCKDQVCPQCGTYLRAKETGEYRE